MGAKVIETSTFFIFATFTVSYAVSLGYERSQVLTTLLITAVLGVPSMLAAGALSDRIGRKKVFLAGTVAVMVFILPYLWLINQQSILHLAIACFFGFTIIWPTYGSLLGTLIAESFTPDVRYTGASLGYQFGAAIAGGPAPLIATALMAAYGGSFVPVGIFVIVCGCVSLVAVSFSKDRHNQELD
jgi:MFS family permease